MKKYILGILGSLAVVSSGCNALDIDPTYQYSESTAYASIDNLDLYVKDFYRFFHSIADIETGSSLTSIEDMWADLYMGSWYNVAGGTVNKSFYLDNYVTVESNFRSNWGTMYSYIRIVNEFLVDLHDGRLSKLNQTEVAKREGEARMIRAFAYLELTKRFGGVILRVSEEKVDDHRDNDKARSTTAECYEFIISELQRAAELLPESWDSSDTGRLTKGAAYGLIARAALYADRWDDAIDAATETMKYYSLMPGTTYAQYDKIFTTINNSELIIPVYFEVKNKQHAWNTYMCPPGDAAYSGYATQFGGAAAPTEEYASSFQIKVNGAWENFDWKKLADYGNKPYDNRDPRFYESILYNGATWTVNGSTTRTIQCYENGTDQCMTFQTASGQDNVHRGVTGYYTRKFLTTKEYNFVNVLSDQYWIEMRLAEIYLIRSEAYARKGEYAKAYADLNTIRQRVGLTDKAVTGSWDEYLEDLMQERICELGTEGHRFTDLVRWGKTQEYIADQKTHGVKVTKNSDGSFSYEVIEVDTEPRKFPLKYSIFPIPYTEVQNNPLCEQNELWK